MVDYKNKCYNFYLYYLRYRIKKIISCYAIINLFKNINFFFKNISSDTLNNIIIDCIKRYPLNNYELQKFSILQQQFENNLGIENYVTFSFWICIMISLKEKNNLLK